MGLRTKNLTLKATEAEHAAWSSAAKSDGRTLSQWLVRRANGEPTTPPVWSPPQPAQPAQPAAAPVKRPAARGRRRS